MSEQSVSVANGDNSLSPLLLGAEDAAKFLSVGRSFFYGMNSSGRLGPLPVTLGKRTLWRRKELESWVDAGCPTREQWQNGKAAQG